MEIANRDKERLGNFIKLIDYMMVETLVSVNHQSMRLLLEEMKKERKTGLFNIGLREEQMTFDPNDEDLKDNIENTLKNMIDVVKSVHRIPAEIKASNMSDEKPDRLADIGGIVSQSVEFNEVRSSMNEQIRKDFGTAQDYVEENYKKVRFILGELKVFQMPKW